MTQDTLYATTILTTTKTGLILDELLAAEELYFTSSFERSDASAHMALHFEEKSDADALEIQIHKLIEQWGRFQDFDSCEVFVQTVRKEDWSEVWKNFFHPEKVSDRIVIKPSWEDYSPKDQEVILEIDPGMSFGTGQHGTTKGCLQYIDELSLQYPGATLIDMGCGSGILSMAAAKLGFTDIEAFDYDESAADIARENLKAAGVAELSLGIRVI